MSSYHGPGTYYIINSATGTAVDLLNGGSTAGTAVNGWSAGYDNNTHQIWLIADVGRGAVIILNTGTGTYISAPQTDIRVTGNSGSPTNPYYRWNIQPQSDGSVLFASVAYPGKVLDLSNSGTADGTPVLVWVNNLGKNQRWNLVPYFN